MGVTCFQVYIVMQKKNMWTTKMSCTTQNSKFVLLLMPMPEFSAFFCGGALRRKWLQQEEQLRGCELYRFFFTRDANTSSAGSNNQEVRGHNPIRRGDEYPIAQWVTIWIWRPLCKCRSSFHQISDRCLVIIVLNSEFLPNLLIEM